MNAIREITSSKNPSLRALIKLWDRRTRDATQKFYVEGVREILRATDAGYELEELFLTPGCEQRFASEVEQILPRVRGQRFRVAPQLLDRIAMRAGSEGIVAIFAQKHLELENFDFPEDAFLLVVDQIEKPGNLGAILRTSDGLGASGIFVTGKSVDLFNPNVVRSSLGCVFSVPTVFLGQQQAADFLEERGFRLYGAALGHSALPPWKADLAGRSAVVLGSEANGLGSDWLERLSQYIEIPMLGAADSLNVSVTAAMIAYEARRQRDA